MTEQRLRPGSGPAGAAAEKRKAERRPLAIPGHIVWLDAGGRTQMASVVTRDVSELGVRVECLQGPAIPLFRIAYLQLDRVTRGRADLPRALRKSNVLSAIFRVGECSPCTGAPTEYALRLLHEPGSQEAVAEPARERKIREDPQRPTVRT